jgi:hypothetical protein
MMGSIFEKVERPHMVGALWSQPET